MSIEAQYLLRLLAEDFRGAAAPYDMVLAHLARAVAPGKAMRRYDTNERNRERHHGPRRGRQLSDDEKIRSGQRSIAVDTMHSMRKRFVEITGTGPDRRIRRRQVPLPIADPRGTDPPITASGEPPGELAPPAAEPAEPAAVAFISEVMLRRIIAEEVSRVVGRALDAFQHGMQSWLGTRFAELERARRPNQSQAQGNHAGPHPASRDPGGR